MCADPNTSCFDRSTINELLNKLASHDLARAAGAQSTLTGLGALHNLSRILDEQLKASFASTVLPRRTASPARPMSPGLPPRPPSAASLPPAPASAPPSAGVSRALSLQPTPRRASTAPGSSRPVSLVENPEMAARLLQAELEMKAMLGKVADEPELPKELASPRVLAPPTMPLDPIERPSSVKIRPQTPKIRLSSHDGELSPPLIPRPVSDFQRNVIDILNSLNSSNLPSIPDVVAFWVNTSPPDMVGPTLHDLTVAIIDKATENASFAWLYAELCSKLMSRISLPLNKRNSAKLESGMQTGGDLARGEALFRRYLADRCTGAAESGVRQAAVWKFVEELLAREALTEDLLHRAIERLLPRCHLFKDDEAKSLYKLLTIFGRRIRTLKAYRQMTVYCQQLDGTRDNEEISGHVCTLLLSTKGFLRRSPVLGVGA